MQAVQKYLAISLPFFVLILIFVGALVTSHAAGLTVPDWPTTFGENMFLYPVSKWQGGLFYEHFHRLVASFIGFLTLLLTASVFINKNSKKIRLLAVLALIAVCLQGLLGGLTVLYELPTYISASHGILAQSFFLLTIYIAYLHSREYQQSDLESPKSFYKLVLAFSCVVFVQLIIAAFMRHSGSGLAISDFPTMGAQWLPAFSTDFVEKVNQVNVRNGVFEASALQVGLHFLHRFFALLIFGMMCSLGIFIFRNYQKISRKFFRSSVVIINLCLLQIFLGIATLLSKKLPYITSLHVCFGALTLGLLAFLAMRTYRALQR